MTVLVTGGAGYIGGHMVLALLDAGEKLVVLDDLSTGFRWAVPEAAKLIVGDVGDAALVDAIGGAYGRAGASQKLAHEVLARLASTTTKEIFRTTFVEDNDRLGQAINGQYLLH